MGTSRFEELLNSEFRWPKTGDKLFSAPVQPLQGAFVANHARERLHKLCLGYLEAGNHLVEATEQQAYLRDSFLYPIVFCYRHYLELEIKYVLVEYGHLANVQADHKSHDFTKLWPKCRSVITHWGDCEGIDVVEACVAEFAKLDAGSFTFRYAFDREGRTLTIDLDNVNLASLRDTMQSLSNFFLGVDGYLNSMDEG